MPGYLVFYKTDDQNEIINFRIKRVARNEGMMHENVKPEKWLAYLQQLQIEHLKECTDVIDITGSYGGTI